MLKINWHSRTELFPSDWFQGAGNSSILLSVYSVPTLQKDDLKEGSKIIDMPMMKVRAILACASFVYPDISDAPVRFLAANAFRMNGAIALRTAPEGVYLIMVTPVSIHGEQKNALVVKQTIENALSLCLLFMGKGIAFKHVFDNELTLDGSSMNIIGPSYDNPWWLGKPDTGQSTLCLISQTEKALFSLSPHEENRIVLSLRWFSMAIYESGVDSFLKYWIAIETMAMPDTTNIRPVLNMLAEAYGIQLRELTKDRFLVGRLFRLRGRIVHDGDLVRIPISLLLYMQGLYADILLHYLKIPILRKAELILSNPRTNDFTGLLNET